MRKFLPASFSSLIAVLLLARLLSASSGGDILVLHENWALQSSAKVTAPGKFLSTPDYRPDGWYRVSVPSTVLAALVENGVYPDPYYGLNLKAIPGYRESRWLAMKKDSPFAVPWWYRLEFMVPPAMRGKRLALHFDGVNYQANVWLNGKQIADKTSLIGMFRRFEIDITGHARAGHSNVLAVEILPPGQIPDIRYTTKQVEATTGWDDHNPQPPDLNMGIWRKVYLKATGPVTLEHPYVRTKLELPSLEVARLTISAELTNRGDDPASGELRGSIEGMRFSQAVSFAPLERRVVTFTPQQYPVLTVRNPRVWWPNLVGRQELYDLNLEFVTANSTSDSAKVRFGIREATTYINEEGWRGYRVNGRNILIRGGAWMTSDMLLRLPVRRYEALIRYARNANWNMLRSEGFSIRETEEFYSLCDQYGIMVTQQIFGRSIPDEKLAVANVRDMMLRIRNHPSLVHFLGHDETFPTPSLDEAYRQLIAEYIPHVTYQPHSGAFDVRERNKTGGTRTGTRELWTYANPAHYYTHKEDGAWGFAQSGGIGGVVAPLESVRRMMPKVASWPPWTETWSFHTVIQGGGYFDAMLQALARRYGPAKSIEDFTAKGLAMNYESARGMFEAYGRNKYAATGITTWKYDAAWPASPTWQYVDWYLIAGGAYYGAQKACEPLHVQYSYDDHSVWVVNSHYEAFRGLKVSARVLDFDMKERSARSASVEVGPDGKSKAFVIAWPPGLSKTHFLKLALADSSGRHITDNFYWLSTVPDIEGTKSGGDRAFRIDPKSTADFTDLAALPPVRLSTQSRTEDTPSEKVVHVTVRNPSDRLAFQVQLAVTRGAGGAEVAPAYWSENYFSLLPGESKTIRAIVAAADLEGASPAVRVSGWNVSGQ